MALNHLGNTRGVGLKSFWRRSSGSFLVQGTIELLDRAERFSQPAAHGSRGVCQYVQHVLFVFGLDLLPVDRCAILTSNCLERDDVVLPPTRDGALDGGRGSFADADF